jgi:hypothetical protein
MEAEGLEVKVYVGQKPFRGNTGWASRKGCTIIDVTSSTTTFGSEMSPLYLGPCKAPDGLEALRFENLYQYSKAYSQLGHIDEKGELTDKWRAWRADGFVKLTDRTKGIRRPPEVADLRRHQPNNWAPAFSVWGDERLTYIEARKKLYVPEYLKLIRGKPLVEMFKKRASEKGEEFLFIDFDGPRLADYPNGMQVTVESLDRMLNYPGDPFGHGYVVAAYVGGLEEQLLELCKQ